MRFRGREMAHQEIGLALLKRVEADLAEVGVIEQFPRLEGRQMVMFVREARDLFLDTIAPVLPMRSDPRAYLAG